MTGQRRPLRRDPLRSAALRTVPCALLLAGLIWPAAGQATKVSGAVLFDGGETRPPDVQLVFTGRGGFPKRTLQVSGQATSYAFNLTDDVYTTVDASFDTVAADAFWLPAATAAVKEVAQLLPLPPLIPTEFRADDLVFKRGIRLALPIADLRGRRFRAPRGWRSRGGTVSVDFGPDVRIASNTRVITGIANPADASVTLTLAYSDSFGSRREISPPTLRFTAPASAAGTTVSEPKIRIDASAPTIRARPAAGRNVAVFISRDRQSGVSIVGSSAYVKTAKGYRRLSDNTITVIDAQDPDHALVPRGYTGVRVAPQLSGRREVRFCAANGHGVLPSFSRCPRAVVG